MPTITLEGISLNFGVRQVLRNLTLEINEGEFLVLLGNNGSGKTTLLRLIAGLELPSAGTVRFGERVMNEVEAKDRDVAMVFQNAALYPQLTVIENIQFAPRLAGVDQSEIDSRAAEVVKVLELDPLLTRLPRELSAGERQKVAIGSAIARRPRVFLLDEPLGNLDHRELSCAGEAIIEAHANTGATTIYATTDPEMMRVVADRTVTLRDGSALVENASKLLS